MRRQRREARCGRLAVPGDEAPDFEPIVASPIDDSSRPACEAWWCGCVAGWKRGVRNCLIDAQQQRPEDLNRMRGVY